MPKHAKKSHERLQYTKDKLGHDILLKDNELQVMMEWEKPYMEACIDALKPVGDVLEIGFGLGYSASQIQKYHPRSHTIIECEPSVIQKANEWLKQYPNSNIKIIEGFWQEKLEKTGVFDAIFFDDYTPLSAEEVSKIEADTKSIQKEKKNLRRTTNSLKAVFKEMQGIPFTDEQVLEFFLNLQNRPEKISQEEVIDFIQTLVEQENMTIQQEIRFLDEYEKINGKKSDVQKVKAQGIKDRQTPGLQGGGDRLLNFYQLSLDQHMRKGSRMSSYIDLKQFKNNYKNFEKLIASRKDVDLKQKMISVDVPTNCQYYSGDQALVLIITKK